MPLNNATTRAYTDFERQIRATLKTFQKRARDNRRDARYHATAKNNRDYSHAARLEALALGFECAAEILVRDYSFLKVFK